MEFCPQRFSWLVSWQDGHSFHSLIFMVDKTFFKFFDKFIFWGGRSRVMRMRMNVCVQCVGEFLQDVRWNTIISGQKSESKTKKTTEKLKMWCYRAARKSGTQAHVKGVYYFYVRLSPRVPHGALTLIFFSSPFLFFFLWLAPRNLPGKGGSSRSLKY